MKYLKNFWITSIAFLIFAGILGWVFTDVLGFKGPLDAPVTNYEECVADGNPVMESFPEQCKTPDGQTFVREVEQAQPAIPTGEATIKGEVVCLPHKGEGPHTMECAFGLKEVGTGNHYALRLNDPLDLNEYPTGEIVAVTGNVIQDSDSQYDIVGVIEVKLIQK